MNSIVEESNASLVVDDFDETLVNEYTEEERRELNEALDKKALEHYWETAKYRDTNV